MEEEKPFIFDGFSLPTDRVWFAFTWWHFPDRRVSGKNTSRWSYVTKSAAPKLMKKSLLESSLRSKRFQSSYCAKVRAGAKKNHSPPPPPSFLFFCSRPNFLDELARKRLLRRLPRKLHTIPYNKIIRNCMELSGILTVQALCVFSGWYFE